MSKRQRFVVELREGEVTVISWKKLLAGAERVVTGAPVPAAAAAGPPKPSVPTLTPALNADIPETLKNSLKPRRKVNPDVTSSKPAVRAAERKRRGSPLGDRHTSSAQWKEKASVEMVRAVTDEVKQVVKRSIVMDKVHGSMPAARGAPRGKTSCARTKKQTNACLCCCKKTISRSWGL